MNSLKCFQDQNFSNKTVLLRLDLNVPMKDGLVQDDTRIRATLPTLLHLIEQKARIVIMSHLGRPKGEFNPQLSLKPVANALSQLLSLPVNFVPDCRGDLVKNAVAALEGGDLLLLENTRFHTAEKSNDSRFAQELAGLADVFVNDAFGAIHRAHASVLGVTEYLPSYAGYLLQKEVKALQTVLDSPQKPFALVMGGAKIDTKIGVFDHFLNKADLFIIGGALANTFLAAQGYKVGASLFEEDQIDTAKQLLLKAKENQVRVFLPEDLYVGRSIGDSDATLKSLNEVEEGDMILDLGPQTLASYKESLSDCAMVVWNGPMGFYENEAFSYGTSEMANFLAKLDAKVLVGGGDSLDALNSFSIPFDAFHHVSTGGGAMLEFLEGKDLPGLTPLWDS